MNAGERSARGKSLKQLLSGERCLLIPRIPGVDEYLAALDESVARVKAGTLGPKAALDAAAQKWDAITDRLGRAKQRAAYLKHLNISEP